ncbi:MAG: tyrosine-type recombinase/integrase [Fibrobacteria bacterium]|nr:tyrosine-type recombinase/integrase [Fibrobacteria bacterium]
MTQFRKHPLEVNLSEIKTYIYKLTKSNKYEAATINLHISGIKYFYNHVLNTDEKNGALIKLKLPEKLFEVLSVEEMRLILSQEQDLRNRLLIKCGYAFGLRVNRAVNLKLSDFDFQRKLLYIQGDKGKKDRYIMMSEDFNQELKNYLAQNSFIEDEDYLFPSKMGGVTITPRHANKILHIAVNRVGIKKNISYHSLRRTFATHLHEAGYSLRDIQVVMGHSTSKTTEKYTKVSSKHISGITSPLDALYKSDGKK